jgi:hypothetical protein
MPKSTIFCKPHLFEARYTSASIQECGMRITRRRHDSKKGRLLVWEKTPGVDAKSLELYHLEGGGIEIQLHTHQHVWGIELNGDELTLLKNVSSPNSK